MAALSSDKKLGFNFGFYGVTIVVSINCGRKTKKGQDMPTEGFYGLAEPYFATGVDYTRCCIQTSTRQDCPPLAGPLKSGDRLTIMVENKDGALVSGLVKLDSQGMYLVGEQGEAILSPQEFHEYFDYETPVFVERDVPAPL